MNNINNNNRPQNSVQHDELYSIPGVADLNEADIQRFAKLTKIDFAIFESFFMLPSQRFRPHSEVVTNCLAVIKCLKSHNTQLLNIKCIEINDRIKINKKSMDILQSFEHGLTELKFNQVSFAHDRLPSFHNFLSLKKLTIFDSSFSSMPNDFCPPSIEELDIRTSLVTEPFDLKRATNLKKLSIQSHHMKALPKNPGNQLKVVDIYQSCGIENLDLTEYSNVEILKVRGSPNLRRSILQNIPSNLKQLNVCELSSLKEIQSIDCPYLEELSITHSMELESVSKITSHSLKKLNLCCNLSLTELPDLEECPNLKELNISNTSIKTIPKNLLGKLTKINLAHCYDLNAVTNVVNSLSNLSSELTELDLSGCLALMNSLSNKS